MIGFSSNKDEWISFTTIWSRMNFDIWIEFLSSMWMCRLSADSWTPRGTPQRKGFVKLHSCLIWSVYTASFSLNNKPESVCSVCHLPSATSWTVIRIYHIESAIMWNFNFTRNRSVHSAMIKYMVFSYRAIITCDVNYVNIYWSVLLAVISARQTTMYPDY